jgi:hypothetical protein
MAISDDVCEFRRIYRGEGQYNYSLPEHVLRSFYSGNSFDYKKDYSPDELKRLHDDINEIFQTVLADHPVRGPIAVLTAGASGVGKTVKLHQDLKAHTTLKRRYAYVCPDDVCLKSMRRTYVADIEKSDGSAEARAAAYNKWRPGSNAAAHLILANLIREKIAFYFGTTSSGDGTPNFYKFIKSQGYSIRVIHLSAPDDVRLGSIQERNTTFIQVTAQDVQAKGRDIVKRIEDTFLSFATTIEFWEREEVNGDAHQAAVWVRNPEGSPVQGHLLIVCPVRYVQAKAIHNAATEALNLPNLRWEATVERHSSISLAQR